MSGGRRVNATGVNTAGVEPAVVGVRVWSYGRKAGLREWDGRTGAELSLRQFRIGC